MFRFRLARDREALRGLLRDRCAVRFASACLESPTNRTSSGRGAAGRYRPCRYVLLRAVKPGIASPGRMANHPRSVLQRPNPYRSLWRRGGLRNIGSVYHPHAVEAGSVREIVGICSRRCLSLRRISDVRPRAGRRVSNRHGSRSRRLRIAVPESFHNCPTVVWNPHVRPRRS